MMLKRLKAWVPAVMVVAGVIGCGEGPPTSEIVPTVEAAGVLTYNGKPLSHHQITVVPDNGRPAMATTDEEGRFTLGTNAPGDGAVPGTHRVTVIYVGPPSDNPEEGITVFTTPPKPAVQIDRKFASERTTDLMVEIPPDGSTELRIELGKGSRQ